MTCQNTNADASLTVISGNGTNIAVAGMISNVTVTLFDSGNNRLLVGGDTIKVTIEPSISLIEVFDNNDGSYLV